MSQFEDDQFTLVIDETKDEKLENTTDDKLVFDDSLQEQEDFKQLIATCNQLINDKQYKSALKLLEDIDVEKRTSQINMLLGKVYNELALEDDVTEDEEIIKLHTNALECLLPLAGQFDDDAQWFYYTGLAYVGLNKDHYAISYLKEALRLNPNNQNIRDLFTTCSLCLSSPSFEETYTDKVHKRWQEFLGKESDWFKQLKQLDLKKLNSIAADKDSTAFKQYSDIQEQMSKLFEPICPNIILYVESTTESKLRVTLRHEVFYRWMYPLNYVANQMPEQLNERWEFVVGHVAHDDLNDLQFTWQDQVFNLEDTYVKLVSLQRLKDVELMHSTTQQYNTSIDDTDRIVFDSTDNNTDLQTDSIDNTDQIAWDNKEPEQELPKQQDPMKAKQRAREILNNLDKRGVHSLVFEHEPIVGIIYHKQICEHASRLIPALSEDKALSLQQLLLKTNQAFVKRIGESTLFDVFAMIRIAHSAEWFDLFSEPKFKLQDLPQQLALRGLTSSISTNEFLQNNAMRSYIFNPDESITPQTHPRSIVRADVVQGKTSIPKVLTDYFHHNETDVNQYHDVGIAALYFCYTNSDEGGLLKEDPISDERKQVMQSLTDFISANPGYCVVGSAFGQYQDYVDVLCLDDPDAFICVLSAYFKKYLPNRTLRMEPFRQAMCTGFVIAAPNMQGIQEIDDEEWQATLRAHANEDKTEALFTAEELIKTLEKLYNKGHTSGKETGKDADKDTTSIVDESQDYQVAQDEEDKKGNTFDNDKEDNDEIVISVNVDEYN